MEEAGAALLCGPLLGSSVLAVAVLNAAGDRAAAESLLPPIAAGTSIAAAALTGSAGTWAPGGVEVAAQAGAGGGAVLSGRADYVIHAQSADVLLVLAEDAHGHSWYIARPADAAITPLPTFDHTLRLARVEFSDAPATPLGDPGAGWAIAERALDVARVALAGEQAGGARRALDMTVDYAKTRVQFGRPIGSFQAIKHMAADLLLDAESAASAARHAAAQLADAAADASLAIDLAAFACADAFVSVSAASIQMHGGIAFTWDHPAHLYLRRARADAQLLGASSYYRERYVRGLEAQPR
jgi:alkylation response protein AidB-like acyl-CoA dehydrogenase